MKIVKANQIGLVAHYSEQGNWAFEEAFNLAKEKQVQLNIFCFSEYTYFRPFDEIRTDDPDAPVTEEKLITEERKLREYYDTRLGDFYEVGFKLCTRHGHNFELKSCLFKNQFQILVIPYSSHDMQMDNTPIQHFARNFVAPVILVGPERATQYHLNYPACLLAEYKSLPERFRESGQVEKLPAADRGTYHIRY